MEGIKMIRNFLIILGVLAVVINYSFIQYHSSLKDNLDSAEEVTQERESLDDLVSNIILTRKLLGTANTEIKKNLNSITTVKDNTMYTPSNERVYTVEKSFSYLSVNHQNASNEVLRSSKMALKVREKFIIYRRSANTIKPFSTTNKRSINFSLIVQTGAVERPGYYIRGPTRQYRASTGIANKPITNDFMKPIIFSKKQKERIAIVAKYLFPGYRYISTDGNSLRFSQFKKGSFSSFLVPDVTTKIPIFELLFNEFPKRLSIYKCGNSSFAPLYMVGMLYVLSINPSSIADYIYEKFQSIEPYKARDQALKSIKTIIQEESDEEHFTGIRINERSKKLGEIHKDKSNISRSELLGLIDRF